MDGHGMMTVVACAGDLAFGVLALLRRSRSPLGVLIAVLFFDAFTWNFASLAYDVSRNEVWHAIDRLFSSMMAAFALHVVAVFVGRSRSLRWLIVGCYAVFSAIGVGLNGTFWWKYAIAVLGPLAMLVAVLLLVRHRRGATDASERARADLVLLAILVGTLFALTDLFYHGLRFPLPRLGAIGTLVAMVLFATATLRLRLLGGDVPPVLGLYALLFGALWVALHLALTRWLDPRSSPWVLGACVLVLIGVVAARELGQVAAVGRARTQELAMLGRFSEQLAHDIKNPLAALKGAAQFLVEERRRGHSLDGHGSFLTLIEQQIDRVQRIVGDYQRIAKVESRPVTTSLNALVAELLPLQNFGVVPGITLRADLAPDLPEAPLDRDLVVTALENVVRNACEAMPNGGVVTLRTAYDAQRDALVLRVEDPGKGMDARELEQAAALFFTTKAQGTGLGLSFAERVTKAHGGALRIESALGRGTTIEMSFRRQPEGTP
jgi:two-component system sensor histidine kinase HydH